MNPRVQPSISSFWIAFSDFAFAFFFLWYTLLTFTHERFALVGLENTAKTNGYSDHRGVVAYLRLK